MKIALRIFGYCVLALATSLVYPYTPTISGGLVGLFVLLLISDIVDYKYGKRLIASLVPRETILKLGVSPIIAFAVCVLWLMFASSFLSSLLAAVSVGFSFIGLTLAVISRNRANDIDEN
jgi:VIT1/CCC1 family predicted Fe2+/Mn2+ transporter